MNDNDFIQRFIIENAHVRGEIVHLTQSYQTIVQQQPYSEAIKVLLGESLVAASLMSAIIKFKGRLTLQFQGREPLKLLLAQCTDEFKVRGLVQGNLNSTKEEFQTAFGEGTLAIIIAQDNRSARYQGIVTWQDNLAKSVEGYFKNSEQIPTCLWIAVNETTACGLLLQALPHETTLKSQPIQTNSDWEHIIHLTETLTPEELMQLDPLTLLHRLYSQEQVRVFTPHEVEFGCTCSLARSENAIQMLGKEEADAELNEKQAIVVTCEFCGKEYRFDRIDVESLFKRDSGSQMH